jgi:hypothetical protein
MVADRAGLKTMIAVANIIIDYVFGVQITSLLWVNLHP